MNPKTLAIADPDDFPDCGRPAEFCGCAEETAPEVYSDAWWAEHLEVCPSCGKSFVKGWFCAVCALVKIQARAQS